MMDNNDIRIVRTFSISKDTDEHIDEIRNKLKVSKSKVLDIVIEEYYNREFGI